MSEQKQSTIVAGDEILTMIITFVCAEVRQNELVEALSRATTDLFEHLDGFISASLHVSLDRTRVVNYAQWRSVEDLDRAQVDPKVQEHLAEVLAIAESVDPRLFHVRAVHHV